MPAAGCYRAVPIKVNPRQRTLHAMYRTYLDVVHIAKEEKGRQFADVAAMKAASQEASRPRRASTPDSQVRPLGCCSSGAPAPVLVAGFCRITRLAAVCRAPHGYSDAGLLLCVCRFLMQMRYSDVNSETSQWRPAGAAARLCTAAASRDVAVSLSTTLHICF